MLKEKTLEEKIPTWARMKKVIFWVLRFKQILLRKIKIDVIKELLHSNGLLQESEVQLIKFVLEKRFSANLKILVSRVKIRQCPEAHQSRN